MVGTLLAAQLQMVNATYSRVAQCEAEMEALRTENNRYFYYCTLVVIHGS